MVIAEQRYFVVSLSLSRDTNSVKLTLSNFELDPAFEGGPNRLPQATRVRRPCQSRKVCRRKMGECRQPHKKVFIAFKLLTDRLIHGTTGVHWRDESALPVEARWLTLNDWHPPNGNEPHKVVARRFCLSLEASEMEAAV